MARRIEIWPTDRLVPYARNARTHSAEQVAQIAASIVEFGFTNPILVDSMDGIIAGHGRLLAARKLGLSEVPVVVLDHLSDTQRRAYIIADNKLAMNAGWDEKLLASELRDLEKDGMDLAVVGFSDEELEALLKDGEATPENVADEVPEPPVQPVTQPGDVWLIGKHRLICGDCRDMEMIRTLFGDAHANVVVTSPPYATQREYDASSGFKPVRPGEYVEWFGAVASGVESILAPDGSYFLLCGEPHNRKYAETMIMRSRRRSPTERRRKQVVGTSHNYAVFLASLSIAISLSETWNLPRLSVGGTPMARASSFSDGSALR
jgi:hypothetical protein